MKVRIFTDGACSQNPGPGGWAAIILLPKSKHILKGNDAYTTNNRMELYAAICALKTTFKNIKTIDTKNLKVDLYSDSAYVVNTLKNDFLKKWTTNGWLTVKGKPVKNKDLWMEIHDILHEHRKVNFIKVKGHDNVEYNNQCDEIAKEQVKKVMAKQKQGVDD